MSSGMKKIKTEFKLHDSKLDINDKNFSSLNNLNSSKI